MHKVERGAADRFFLKRWYLVLSLLDINCLFLFDDYFGLSWPLFNFEIVFRPLLVILFTHRSLLHHSIIFDFLSFVYHQVKCVHSARLQPPVQIDKLDRINARAHIQNHLYA